MVDAVDDLKTSQSIGGRRFPNFEMFDAKIASVLKKIIMNPYFKKKKVHLEEQKSPNGRPISPWKTDCVHDLRILSSNWCT